MLVKYRQVATMIIAGVLGLSLVACGATEGPPRTNAGDRGTASAVGAPASNVPTTIATDAPASDAADDAANPVAQRIADEFGVPVSEVEGYHDQGMGYGVLAQLYAIANNRCGGQSRFTVVQLVEMHQNGMGLGEIRKQVLGTASAHDCNLGRLKQNELDKADENDTNGNNGKGKGNGKGTDK